ncbi:MAG: SPOR domain-containing protein [Candidatus Zixiibacteriota bacterium]
MARLFLVCIILAGFLLVGCSKEDEDVDALGDKAAQDEAAAVMDSLNNVGAGTATKEQGTSAEDTQTKKEPKVKHEPEVDYSGLHGYVVQVGSYSDYDFAKMMSEKFTQRDYPAFVVSTEIDGMTYYRLRIGVYETYAEAKEVGDLVKDRYSTDYWIDNN